MKRFWILTIIMLLITGCTDETPFEPVKDVYAEETAAPMRQIMLEIPEDATVTVMETQSNGKMYFCDDYTLTVYTTLAGDLQKTVKNATGFSMEELQMLKVNYRDMTKYLCVWTAAGEGATQVGRACILDDGHYHYVLTAMTQENQAGELLSGDWETVFRSFDALTPDQIVNSGS